MLLAAAVGFLFAFGLTCLVFVWTNIGQAIDGVLLPRAERGGGYVQETVLLEPAQRLLSLFGRVPVLALLLVLVLLTGVLSKRVWAGVAGVGVVLGSVAVSGVLKTAITRPDLEVYGSTLHNSFPSGHVAAAAGLLFAFLLVLPVRGRWWLAVPGAAGIAIIASATMIAGWHRFSDAIGGVLLAAALCCLAAAIVGPRHRLSRVDTGNFGWLVGIVALIGQLPVVLVLAATLPVQAGLSIAVVAADAGAAVVVAAILLLLQAVDSGSRLRHRQ
jgi:membrane-associated phospholipid phosphatase